MPLIAFHVILTLQAIMPMRVLHLHRDSLDYLMEFKDNIEDRDMEESEEQVVRRIREEWGQDQYTVELVRRVDPLS